MPRLDSPARRVLGDKTTNASIRSDNSTKTWLNPTASRDTLSVSFGDSTRSPKSSDQFKSPRVSKKRGIEEVEGHERDDSQQSAYTQQLSQVTDVLSDHSSQMDDVMVDSRDGTTSTAQTSLISLHASQAEESQGEVQFEIHEEMSQRTLDKMHEIALPQNNSQCANLLRPTLLKEASQISVSMSSLINFDEDNPSQPSDGVQILEPVHDEQSASKRAKSEEDNRKEMLFEKAEALRTRLQLAFYKVSTNQASKPFSRLNQTRPKSPELPPQPLSSSPMTPQRHLARFASTSPESRIAIARARATMQAKPRVRLLDQIAHPTIVPTTFSARNVGTSRDAYRPQIPSSPRSTGANEGPVLVVVRAVTPTPPKKMKRAKKADDLPKTPMQLSSPPGSPLKKSTARKLRDSKGKYGGLTSSVVKGEAASGLMELMKGSNGNVVD